MNLRHTKHFKDQHGRMEHTSAPKQNRNTPTSGTIFTENQLETGKRSLIQPKQ